MLTSQPNAKPARRTDDRPPMMKPILIIKTSFSLIVATSLIGFPIEAQIRARNAEPKARGTQGPVTNALPGCGQGVPSVPVDAPPPPERKKLGASPGGVDMRSGTFNFQNVDVSIGGEGDAGLSLVRSFSLKNSSSTFRQAFGQFFTHNWDIQIQERRLPRAGDCYPNQYAYSETVVYGELGDNFFKQGNVGVFNQTAPYGYAELVFTGTTIPNNLVFTARDGTIIRFPSIGDNCPGVIINRCGYASTIDRPDGTRYMLEYETLSDGNAKRLRSVTSNRGFALLFEYAGQADGFQQTTKVCALNLSTMLMPSNKICLAGAATVSYGYDGTVQTSATQVTGGTWLFGQPSAASFSLTMPGSSQPYVTNNYSIVQGGNDLEPSFVIDSQQFVTGQTYAYSWSILNNDDGQGSSSQQVAGGSWIDNQNHSVSAEYGSYYEDFPQGAAFPVYMATPGPEKVTDELQRVTRYNYCGSAAPETQCYIPPLQSVTDPEGKVEKFAYAVYRNIGEVRKAAKPGSGLADLIETRIFDASAPPTSRAKPTSTTDARGGVTDYTYDPVHGGVLSESGPADAGGVRPVKRSGYVQRYAWMKAASGGYAHASSPVWLLSEERTCRTSATSGTSIGATCAVGPGDEVVTAYEYGPDTGAVGNNLLLRGKVVTADGVSLRTCYGYDEQGNKISETSPKGTTALSVCP